MNLDEILFNKPTQQTKTASAQTPAQGHGQQPTAKTASAVSEALAAVTQNTKTAAETRPAGAAAPVFDKLAADLAEQDKEGSIKMAQLYGAAMADGFMSQLGMYEKVAENLAQTQKTAGDELDPEMVELVKMASENPRAFLARVEKAAQEEDAQLKEAEDKEAAELVQQVHLKAAEHYAHGYEVGAVMVRHA